ncbi:hypothetical protein ACQP2X_36490 [Actinoplanes sp. CA-131856]
MILMIHTSSFSLPPGYGVAIVVVSMLCLALAARLIRDIVIALAPILRALIAAALAVLALGASFALLTAALLGY